ncbi:MAG: recombinase family protein [Candidatus Paceibacterota bacterium]
MNIKPKYFLYARKSSEDDDRQVMSIEAQLFELREQARKENLEILAEFQESKSAKTPGREVFGKMMEQVERNEGVGILAWHPDRLARNSMDGGRVIYAVDQKKIVSLCFPTFWFEPTPQGLFMLQVAFGQSKYYSDNLSENIKRGVRQKLRRGEWLNLAPLGYVNNPRLRNIEPDGVKAEIIKRAFEEYAQGTHTYISLAQFLADLGLTTRKGTPLAKVSIKKLLTNRAYLGFIKHGDEWFDGNFEPIVSPQLFEVVQKVLQERERPRKRKIKHDFPFTGIFRCSECGSMISAQWTTNRHGTKYRYYRCSKKHGRCSQSYVREEQLASQLQAQLQTISLCDRYTDWMLDKVKEWEREEVSASQSEVQHLSQKIKADEKRMDKLVSTYLDGDILKEIYLNKKDTIMRSLAALREKEKDVARGINDWVEPLREWILDTKQAAFLSSSSDFDKIASFVKKVGTNPTVRDKSARFGEPAPSQFVAKQRRIFPAQFARRSRASFLSEHEVRFCGG